MARNLEFGDYVRAAWSARPFGLLIPPNWIGVAAAALLGAFVNPGFLVLGLGLELGYLFVLAGNSRFQRWVEADVSWRERKKKARSLKGTLQALTAESRARFANLQARCESVLQTHAGGGAAAPLLDQHRESLNRFVWIFLQLLITREGIMNLARETKLSPGYRQRLEQEITYLARQATNDTLAPDLKRSLEGKLVIVKKRLENLSQGEQKLRYVDAELSRIEQQVELLREQAVLARDSQSMASEIDLVQSSLGDTAEWIREQRSLFGELESLTEEPPPLLEPVRGAREQG